MSRRNESKSSSATNPLTGPAAVALARQAVAELGEGGIGKHAGVAGIGRDVATHRFAADVPGYSGWEWHVVVACAAGSSDVTVNEVALMPGAQALQVPEWVPYHERVRPGDLGPGDLMPPAPDDARLIDGRLAPRAIEEAQVRWRRNFGPDAEMAQQAPLQCRTCAFMLEFRPNFGVCANEYSADGRVVHATYGCGAHSGTKVRNDAEPASPAFDDEKPLFLDRG